MCLSLRNTASRGLAAVPVTFLRILCRIRRRVASLSILFCIALLRLLRAGLAGLLANNLVRVADTLPFVDVGRPQLAKLCRDVADLLAVDPAHGEFGLFLDRDLDSGGNRKID